MAAAPEAVGAEGKHIPAPTHMQSLQPWEASRGCCSSSLNLEKEGKALGTITLMKLEALHANSTWRLGFQAQLHKHCQKHFQTSVKA